MSTPKDGGPAFPEVSSVSGSHGGTGWFGSGDDVCIATSGGMSLRDWFAGHEALRDWDSSDASISNEMAVALAGEPRPEGGWSRDPLGMFKWEAKWRSALKYIRADAMLAERERKVGE